jgi:hypothetical protein
MKVHHRRRRDDMLGFFVPGAVEVIIIGLGLAVFAAFIVGVVALFLTQSSINGNPVSPIRI